MATGPEVTRLQRALVATVRAAMAESEYTVADLAFLTGMDQKRLGLVLSGTTVGTLDRWQRILDVLHIESVDWSAPPAIEPRQPRSRPGPYRCLVDGCQGTPLKHRSTLWQHLTLVHSMSMEDYIEQYGQPVPMTPEEVAALVIEIRCDLCPKVYSTQLGHRWPRSAWIAHMWATHGVKVH